MISRTLLAHNASVLSYLRGTKHLIIHGKSKKILFLRVIDVCLCHLNIIQHASLNACDIDKAIHYEGEFKSRFKRSLHPFDELKYVY